MTGDMDKRRVLATRLDPGELSRHERSTEIGWQGDEDRFRIISYVPSIARKLLLHTHAEIEWVYARPERGRRWREASVTAEELLAPGTNIEGVCASLPVGALTIKGVPRTSDTNSAVINTPEDAEAARKSFEMAESSD